MIVRKSIIGLVLLSGCALPEAGIWALSIPTDSTTECVTEINHNFTDAYQEEDDVVVEDEWTYTDDSTTSDTLIFAQIEELGDGEALLLIGSEAYPGVETDNGWRFSWKGSEDSTNSEEHSSGYAFFANTIGTATETITLNVSGRTAKGKTSAESSTTRSWTESDEWDPKLTGFGFGRIPAQNYLLIDVDGTPQTASNRAQETNCGGADCSLEVVSTCTGEGTFTATQLHYDDPAVYEYLDSSGQDAGL